MKNTLARKRCFLLQEGKFKNGIKEITGIHSVVKLEKMRCSDFDEWALLESRDRMITNIGFYDFFSFPEYQNQKGEELQVYAPAFFIQHIETIIRELMSGCLQKDLRKECRILNYQKGDDERVDFWWDIDNDYYVFFGEEKQGLIKEAEEQMREDPKLDIEEIPRERLLEYYYVANPDLKEIIGPLMEKRKKLVKTNAGNWIEKYI